MCKFERPMRKIKIGSFTAIQSLNEHYLVIVLTIVPSEKLEV